VGYKPTTAQNAPPQLLLILGIAALLVELKTVTFSRDAVTVRYLFVIRRTISMERVHRIETAQDNHQRYILISLDGCPSVQESKVKPATYKLLHPIKLIRIPVTDKKYDTCIRRIRNFYPAMAEAAEYK
jgi:hypothetical protein